jgi:very-short-patch-repair endonuclease
MTIADFYIERGNNKLCVYADGHTYHERTEEQASHDKNIDRKLQEFGYRVMRFTGKEINDNIDSIIKDIKAWFDKSI